MDIPLHSRLVNFLELSSNDEIDYLSNSIMPINKKVRHRNGTLDIIQAIGDENLIYILIELTAKDHTVFDKDYYSFDNYLYVDDYHSFFGIGYHKIEDELTNNKLNIIMSLATSESLSKKKIHFSSFAATIPTILYFLPFI